MLDLTEICYTCSLDEYLGVFFSFFENFHFLAHGTRFGPKWAKIFGAAYRAQKLLDLADIWYTCTLGEYLGFFFSIFENFHFWARGTRFCPKWAKIFRAAYRS